MSMKWLLVHVNTNTGAARARHHQQQQGLSLLRTLWHQLVKFDRGTCLQAGSKRKNTGTKKAAFMGSRRTYFDPREAQINFRWGTTNGYFSLIKLGLASVRHYDYDRCGAKRS